MRELVLCDRALTGGALAALRDEALTSPYVGRSPLVGTFRPSRGFAITFRNEGREAVIERFPYLRPFVDLALDVRSYRPLWSARERLVNVLAQRTPNLFYLNLLLVPQGAAVGPHVDATLSGPTSVPDLTPRVVSVLYLQYAAHWKGGLLRLSRQGRPVAIVQPREGTLLHFRGDLTHEVTALDSDPPGEAPVDLVRASLVCEQYCVAEAVAARLPPLAVRSQGRFQRYLEDARTRGPANVLLDDPAPRRSDDSG